MMPKKSEKKEAIFLRIQGYSLNEIAGRLKVSKASVSVWVRGVALSQHARERIEIKRREARIKAAKTNRRRTESLLRDAAEIADATVSSIKLNLKLMQIICAVIYWCEGEKTKNDKTLTFTNSDSRLVATFLRLLREGFELDEQKFRVCLHLHDYHKEKAQKRFWSHVTGIPTTQFLRTYHKQHTGIRIREGYAGCASIRYYDTRIARQLQAVARAFLKKMGP